MRLRRDSSRGCPHHCRSLPLFLVCLVLAAQSPGTTAAGDKTETETETQTKDEGPNYAAVGEARLAGWPLLSIDFAHLSPQCGADMGQFIAGLFGGAPWAWQMEDSWGRDESGLFNGDLVWEGDYVQCQRTIREAMPIYGLDELKAKYCMTEWYYTGTEFAGIGSCVPSSCKEDDIFTIVNGSHYFLPSMQNLTNTRCYGKEEMPPITNDPSAMAAIAILSFFGLLGVIGTLYDVITKERRSPSTGKVTERSLFDAKVTLHNHDQGIVELQSIRPIGPDDPERSFADTAATPELSNGLDRDQMTSEGANNEAGSDRAPEVIPSSEVTQVTQIHKPNVCEKILLAFSVYSNAPRTLRFVHAPGSYRCFNGIRFLSMAWIIFGHTWQLGVTITRTPTVGNRLALTVLKHRAVQQAEREMHLAVEAFFILSALLTAISFLKQFKKMNGKPTCRFFSLYYFHRFWRLTPVYMLVLMFYATCFNYLGAGPAYPRDYYDAAQCKQSWWKNLLYLNNLVDVNVNTDCMGWTWYLANDFQFYVIAPAFLALLFWKAVAGIVLIVLAVLCSMGVMAYLFIRQDTDYFYGIYNKPWTRCNTYFIGMALGYAMYYVETNKKKIKMPAVAVVFGWIIGLALVAIPVYLPWSNLCCPDQPWNGIGHLVFNCIRRPLFGAGVAWIIWACCYGYGGIVNTLLSWEGWLPLARLTYVGYLIHPIIIYFGYFDNVKQLYITDWTMMIYFLGNILLTMGASFIVSVFLELPFLQLEKVIFPKSRK